MKISLPKYGPSELLIKERGARCIISSVIIGFFAGLGGSYLLKNHFWLLMITVFSLVGTLLCLGAAVGIFLNSRKVAGAPSAKEAPGASINENGPRITPQWDYRPRNAIRVRAVLDKLSVETSDVPSPEPFMINNNVWFNDDSLEGAAPTLVNIRPDAEELITKVLSEATDNICAAPATDDGVVARYDQGPIDDERRSTNDGCRLRV
jgi:hypothetical protein